MKQFDVFEGITQAQVNGFADGLHRSIDALCSEMEEEHFLMPAGRALSMDDLEIVEHEEKTV